MVIALILLVAGVLIGFGAKTAGGCTSGNGLTGTSMLSRAALVATATFFGTAIVGLVRDRGADVRLAGLLVGLVFGVTLSWTGMSDPDVIRDALLFRESYLFLFFASAVLTAIVGVRLLRRAARAAHAASASTGARRRSSGATSPAACCSGPAGRSPTRARARSPRSSARGSCGASSRSSV